jgi:hypothetical protein
MRKNVGLERSPVQGLRLPPGITYHDQPHGTLQSGSVIPADYDLQYLDIYQYELIFMLTSDTLLI